MTPTDVAARLVRNRWAKPVGAWLCGSHAAGAATTESDLDVVVVQESVEPFRETLRYEGMLTELFVHTEASLAHWYAHDAAEYRCTLAHMIATGVPLMNEREVQQTQVALQEAARQHVADGPRDRSVEELDAMRYHLSAAIDDLRGCTSPAESAFIATHLIDLAAGLELAATGSWTGAGKWLYRWLAAANPQLAAELASSLARAYDDVQPLVTAADRVLERAGGRLQEGYRLS